MANSTKKEETAKAAPLISQKGAPAATEGKTAGVGTTLTNESKGFGAVVYLLGLLISILIFLLKKEDAYVKYHAAQAILFDLCVMVVSMVAGACLVIVLIIAGIATMGVGFFLGFWVVWLALMWIGLVLFAFRIFFAYKAFNGERFRLPILGDQAEKLSSS